MGRRPALRQQPGDAPLSCNGKPVSGKSLSTLFENIFLGVVADGSYPVADACGWKPQPTLFREGSAPKTVLKLACAQARDRGGPCPAP